MSASTIFPLESATPSEICHRLTAIQSFVEDKRGFITSENVRADAKCPFTQTAKLSQLRPSAIQHWKSMELSNAQQGTSGTKTCL